MTLRTSLGIPFVLVVALGCSGQTESSVTSNATGGAGIGALGSSGGATAGATSTSSGTSQQSDIWKPSSIAIEIRHSFVSSWLSPDAAVTTSRITCHAIVRDKMSAKQLSILNALVLTKSTPCLLCDASSDDDITVIDADASRADYPGPHCNCAGISPDAIISADFFASFPLDGSEACSK